MKAFSKEWWQYYSVLLNDLSKVEQAEEKKRLSKMRDFCLMRYVISHKNQRDTEKPRFENLTDVIMGRSEERVRVLNILEGYLEQYTDYRSPKEHELINRILKDVNQFY